MKQDTLLRLRRLRKERGGKRWNFRELSFSVGKAAQLLGVSSGTVRRWDREGKFHCFRTAGGQRRIPESEVEYLRSLSKKDFPNIPKQPSRVKSPTRLLSDALSAIFGSKKPGDPKNQLEEPTTL